MANKYKLNRNRIQRMLRLSDIEYCTLQMNVGERYLDVFCLGGMSKKRLEYSRAFWQWWINQWNIVDDYLLKENETEHHLALHNQGKYAEMHLTYLQTEDRSSVKIYPSVELVRLAAKEVKDVI